MTFPTYSTFAKAALLAFVLSSAESFVISHPVLAVPPGETSGAGSGSGSAPIKCERKFAYSETRQGCVRVDSGLIDDEKLYEQGRALALAGHFANALDALLAVRRQSDTRVWTMIGYAQRKMGRADESMASYKKALAIEPNNLDALEYLGEGYVAVGDLGHAQVQLSRIEQICGRDCEQYRDLQAAIAGR